MDIGPHVFPTAKYRLVRNTLVSRGVITEEDGVHPDPVSWEDLEVVHSRDYLKKIRAGTLSRMEEMTLELPFTADLRDASLLCCGGTLLTARKALVGGVAVHLGGGFHHAFRDHGEGFCLMNDVAFAVASLLKGRKVDRCAVVDLDVHQGNGTASIFATERRVFTFSMHQERNYPFPKTRSDLDLGLPDGLGDQAYLSALQRALRKVQDQHEPDLVVYLAGADPFVEDQLGGFSLTREGLEARDRMVLDWCAEFEKSVAVVLAGGYARKEEDTVAIHSRTVEVAKEAWMARN